jgi:hypothetical protein
MKRRSVVEFEKGLQMRIEVERTALRILEAESVEQQARIEEQRVRVATLESVAQDLAAMAGSEPVTAE